MEPGYHGNDRRGEAGPGYLPGYMPLPQAAQWAGVSSRTMKRWIKRGLPVHQAGHREKILIRPVDVDAFLTKKRAPVCNLNAMVDDVLQSMGEKNTRSRQSGLCDVQKGRGRA